MYFALKWGRENESDPSAVQVKEMLAEGHEIGQRRIRPYPPIVMDRVFSRSDWTDEPSLRGEMIGVDGSAKQIQLFSSDVWRILLDKHGFTEARVTIFIDHKAPEAFATQAAVAIEQALELLKKADRDKMVWAARKILREAVARPRKRRRR